jgi:hypothetical protein
VRWWLLVALVACTDPTTATGKRELFQVTSEHVATTSVNAHSYGVDVNGDGTIDNQLSTCFTEIVHEQFGDPQADTDAAMSAGQLLMTFEVQYAADRSHLVNVTSYTTTAADANPPATIADPLVGSFDHDVIDAGPGPLALVIAPFGIPVSLSLAHAHIQAFTTGDALHAVVGGGVDPAVVHEQLVPQWADALTSIVARDCEVPGCSCTAGSPGAAAIGYFDSNRDCSISTEEIEAYPLFQSFVDPDLMIDGKPYVSIGIAIDATIELTVP